MLFPAVFPEPFAAEWGQDEYGFFQSFAVGDVVQRMRWIPPGSFLMGSPESEVGRSDYETQHSVEFTNGYWLGDTPVTQALWLAVMGTNPRALVDQDEPTRPVEQVSWEDCEVFLQRLNERIQGLEARLPTEAEWEYACRAGTTTATWVGELKPGLPKTAPPLEAIAWYHANAVGRTHPVAQKQANPWGLYDVLGNVYEWCRDVYAPYSTAHAVDPNPVNRVRTVGAYRVVRGGGWGSYARHVRAANRNALPPDERFDLVGFRLTRGPALTPRSGA